MTPKPVFHSSTWLAPCHFCLAVGLIVLSHASWTVASEAKTIVVLGDSLAAGYGLDANESYPALLRAKIKEAGWEFSVVNAGVSGDTSAGGLRRLDWVLQRKVDVLVIELGGNDGLRGLPVASLRTNLQAIMDGAKEKNPEVRILLVGMKMPPNLGAYAEEFNRVFPELARRNEAAFVPFLLEGVGGRAELNQPDLIHPTAQGQKILAENVWKVLRPLLASMAADVGSVR
jgi:acyl-CoA thioesterase-1